MDSTNGTDSGRVVPINAIRGGPCQEGRCWDEALGLYGYWARFYDPFVGQFTQPDSLVAGPLDPAAWNRFSYVYNSPTVYADPLGHLAWWAPFLVAGLIGGGLNLAAGYLTSDQYSIPQALTDFANFAIGVLMR